MWSQWHLSAHLLVKAATCLTLVLVVCIWIQYKNKSPSAQVKRSRLLCTLSYPRPQSHRHRDHSATTINLWSLGSWWGVSGRWWNWLQRVLHQKLPWDCFGCWSIAASACILHAVLVFGALPSRIQADAAMWLFKVVVAVLTTFTLTANIVCLSLINQQVVGECLQTSLQLSCKLWLSASNQSNHRDVFQAAPCVQPTSTNDSQQPPEASHWPVRGYTGQWEADQGIHLSPVTGGSKGGDPTSLWLMPNTCLYFCNCA